MKKNLALITTVKLENEDIVINVPLHIRDIFIESKIENVPKVVINAVVQNKEEYKKWGEFLANLPL